MKFCLPRLDGPQTGVALGLARKINLEGVPKRVGVVSDATVPILPTALKIGLIREDSLNADLPILRFGEAQSKNQRCLE